MELIIISPNRLLCYSWFRLRRWMLGFHVHLQPEKRHRSLLRSVEEPWRGRVAGRTLQTSHRSASPSCMNRRCLALAPCQRRFGLRGACSWEVPGSRWGPQFWSSWVHFVIFRPYPTRAAGPEHRTLATAHVQRRGQPHTCWHAGHGVDQRSAHNMQQPMCFVDTRSVGGSFSARVPMSSAEVRRVFCPPHPGR